MTLWPDRGSSVSKGIHESISKLMVPPEPASVALSLRGVLPVSVPHLPILSNVLSENRK